MPPDPLKFLELFLKFKVGQEKNYEKVRGFSLKLFVYMYTLLYTDHIQMYIYSVYIKGFTVMHYSHWLSSTIVRAADL